jgi:membrane protein DedA with SNARE-associated domain
MDRLITEYGLALVFANVLLEQLGLPIPAVPALIVSGALAAAWYGGLDAWVAAGFEVERRG